MLRVGRVSEEALRTAASAASSEALTYDDAGATLGGALPAGFRHDRHEVRLPHGPDAFACAALGLQRWEAHRGAGMSVGPDDPPREGATVAVAAPVGPLTALAVCRIVAVIDEPSRYGFAYGTLPGHPECGEEAFVVEQRDEGAVFRIVAFSRPAELLARAGGPVTRRIQLGATRRYLQAIVDFVAAAPPTTG